MDKFVLDPFSEEIFKGRYAFTADETWEQCCRRVAHQMAIAENQEKVEKYEDIFYNILVQNLFICGGRILYGAGRPNPNMLNCFVLDNNMDSKEGWGNLSHDMIVTSMCGGGVGINFGDIRPSGAAISGHRGECPGPLELMKLINGNGQPIRAGGSRRTALMFSLPATHPDIEKFLDAKLKNGELSLANISMQIYNTKKFIDAVIKNENIELSWKNKYKSEAPAKRIWDKVVEHAWLKGEPGLLNWELAESESNIWYIEPLVTTNPCGEIPLEAFGACCLGHLVLPRFIIDGELNYELLSDTIRAGVRFLDNVLSVNNYPLPEMKDKALKNRRIGMGTTGLADVLVMLGLKYGSDKGNKFVDELYRFISKTAYEASIILAIEKGPFPACRPDLHVQSGFMKRMTPKIKSLVKEHGIRNCAILTVAPTGTVSIVSNNCSSGIEPMFAPAYERRFWDGAERKTELVLHPLFAQFLKAGKDISHFVAAHELSPREHLEIQAIVQKHIDNSVSKTINISEDYPMNELSKILIDYLPRVKGTTIYRDNSRKFVDENGVEQEQPLVPISNEKAIEMFIEKNYGKHKGTMDCSSGMCTL